uniref:V-type proton ATPase subunit H n=1 Tax=Cacopsylla melanoneura TaxID=428564 RepID=A0A8D8T0I2_9HEMI
MLSVLSGRVNFQIQYQLIFCLWVLTFNPKLADRMNKFSVIPILADILRDSVKEKVMNSWQHLKQNNETQELNTLTSKYKTILKSLTFISISKDMFLYEHL